MRELQSGEHELQSHEKENFLSRRFTTSIQRFVALSQLSHAVKNQQKTSGTRAADGIQAS